MPFTATVNAEVPFPLSTPLRVVAPVPPRFTASVPVVSESAMPSDDVASAVGTALPPVALASTEFAVIAARPMVPEVVMVPPVSPLLVAMEVTVPEPLLLKVVQSAEDNAPRLLAEAVGRLNVCVLPDAVIVKSVPVVLVAIVCVAPLCVWPVGPSAVMADVIAELVIVGDTDPTTVKAEHDTEPEQFADDVATLESPFVPFP